MSALCIFYFWFIYMYVWVLSCMWLHSGACGGQKRASDHLELDLQMVMSCHVDAGN